MEAFGIMHQIKFLWNFQRRLKGVQARFNYVTKSIMEANQDTVSGWE